ncbi:MAG: methyl-accepting chemotaxis protein, partial [Caryophanon sp.]|nr:methyl-accepting chemotaxis protein [Caryophanon sp.]
MSIRKKIRLSFGILIFFIFGISLFGYLEISKVNDKYGGMISLELEGFYMTSEFQYNAAMQDIQLRQYVLEKDDDTLRTLEESQKLVDEGVVELFGLAKSDEIKQKITTIEQHNIAFNEAAAEVKAAIASNDEARAITLITQDAKQANTEMLAEAQTILDVVKKRFSATATETNTWVQSILVLLIIISLISLAVAIFIVKSLNRTISKPLHKLAAAAGEISVGNLTVADIETKSNDEVGQLGHAFNKMKASLQDIIIICKDNAIDLSTMSEELTASTTHVATTSGNVATNIEAMSSSITGIASVSQQTSASMEQAAHDIEAIADTTQSLKERSQKASNLATSGNEHLTHAKAQMDTIYHATQSTANVVQNLSEQSQQIQEMTSMITQISDQTNLLALNAAIEA